MGLGFEGTHAAHAEDQTSCQPVWLECSAGGLRGVCPLAQGPSRWVADPEANGVKLSIFGGLSIGRVASGLSLAQELAAALRSTDRPSR